MSDFRTKLLGLGTLAMVFAGMSYGQVNCTTTAGGTTPVTPTLNTVQPILDRYESEAELVSDVVLTSCFSAAATSSGQLLVSASLPITSKAVAGAVAQAGAAGTPAFVAGGNSEAILTITDLSGTLAVPVVQYQGTVGPFGVTFTSINFTTKFTLQISNIRVNANTGAVGTSPLPVTESIFAGTNGLATLVYNNVLVGYDLKSLNTPTITGVAGGYVVCGTGATPAASSFVINLSETFGGFFKTQTGVSSQAGGGIVVQNGEQGSLQNAAASAAIGTAASGTEFTLTFANLPTAATVWMVPTITNPTDPITPATIALTSGTPAASGVWAGFTAFTPSSSGALTVTYQVTASNQQQVESLAIPVYIAFTSNTVAAQGAVTVVAAYAPAAVVTAQATSIPTFIPTSTPVLNGSAIGLCQTSLLFPFVTNQLGFDTGIVLANTSTDPNAAGKSSAVPQSGSCTLNFYGAGSPGTPVPAPNPSGASVTLAAPYVQPTGTDDAFLLSSVAPGFQGYLIAICSYQYGHGYAFLEDGLSQGTANAIVEGYVANVLPNNRALVAGLSESIGQ